MKTLFIVLAGLLLGAMAHGDANKIRYGQDLCDIVTFRTPTERACNDWVLESFEKNVYSLALDICTFYNAGPASRTVNCFERASQWINDQDLRDQTELCEHRHGNYVPRAQCLFGLFTKKNTQASARSNDISGATGDAPEAIQ